MADGHWELKLPRGYFSSDFMMLYLQVTFIDENTGDTIQYGFATLPGEEHNGLPLFIGRAADITEDPATWPSQFVHTGTGRDDHIVIFCTGYREEYDKSAFYLIFNIQNAAGWSERNGESCEVEIREIIFDGAFAMHAPPAFFYQLHIANYHGIADNVHITDVGVPGIFGYISFPGLDDTLSPSAYLTQDDVYGTTIAVAADCSTLDASTDIMLSIFANTGSDIPMHLYKLTAEDCVSNFYHEFDLSASNGYEYGAIRPYFSYNPTDGDVTELTAHFTRGIAHGVSRGDIVTYGIGSSMETVQIKTSMRLTVAGSRKLVSALFGNAFPAFPDRPIMQLVPAFDGSVIISMRAGDNLASLFTVPPNHHGLIRFMPGVTDGDYPIKDTSNTPINSATFPVSITTVFQHPQREEVISAGTVESTVLIAGMYVTIMLDIHDMHTRYRGYTYTPADIMSAIQDAYSDEYADYTYIGYDKPKIDLFYTLFDPGNPLDAYNPLPNKTLRMAVTSVTPVHT